MIMYVYVKCVSFVCVCVDSGAAVTAVCPEGDKKKLNGASVVSR